MASRDGGWWRWWGKSEDDFNRAVENIGEKEQSLKYCLQHIDNQFSIQKGNRTGQSGFIEGVESFWLSTLYHLIEQMTKKLESLFLKLEP